MSFRCVGLFIFFRLQAEGQTWMWLARLPLSGLLTGCLMHKTVHKESYHAGAACYYNMFNAGTTEEDDPHELTQKWHTLAWSAIPLLLRINSFRPDVIPESRRTVHSGILKWWKSFQSKNVLKVTLLLSTLKILIFSLWSKYIEWKKLNNNLRRKYSFLFEHPNWGCPEQCSERLITHELLWYSLFTSLCLIC